MIDINPDIYKSDILYINPLRALLKYNSKKLEYLLSSIVK